MVNVSEPVFMSRLVAVPFVLKTIGLFALSPRLLKYPDSTDDMPLQVGFRYVDGLLSNAVTICPDRQSLFAIF